VGAVHGLWQWDRHQKQGTKSAQQPTAELQPPEHCASSPEPPCRGGTAAAARCYYCCWTHRQEGRKCQAQLSECCMLSIQIYSAAACCEWALLEPVRARLTWRDSILLLLRACAAEPNPAGPQHRVDVVKLRRIKYGGASEMKLHPMREAVLRHAGR